MNIVNEEDDFSQNWTNLISYPASSTRDLVTRLGRTNQVVHNFNFYLAKNTRSLESCKDEGAHLRATVLLKRAMMRTEQLLGMSRPVLTEIFEF